MDFYATSIPWASINPCIDSASFEFIASDQAKEDFERKTNLPWDNLQDALKGSVTTVVECPKCAAQVTVPWTTADKMEDVAEFPKATGYADPEFSASCKSSGCRTGTDITHGMFLDKSHLAILMVFLRETPR